MRESYVGSQAERLAIEEQEHKSREGTWMEESRSLTGSREVRTEGRGERKE